jgi:hypothetical protein
MNNGKSYRDNSILGKKWRTNSCPGQVSILRKDLWTKTDRFNLLVLDFPDSKQRLRSPEHGFPQTHVCHPTEPLKDTHFWGGCSFICYCNVEDRTRVASLRSMNDSIASIWVSQMPWIYKTLRRQEHAYPALKASCSVIASNGRLYMCLAWDTVHSISLVRLKPLTLSPNDQCLWANDICCMYQDYVWKR